MEPDGAVSPAVPAAKYQKLAKVYAELKQKNSVLKGAVQDLTGQNNELQAKLSAAQQGGGKSAHMQGALREREQQLRTMTQEMDALQFQNNQLTKRVEVFQQESGGGKSSGGSKKKKNAAIEEALALQEEQLRRTISENEQIHRAMAELRRASDQRLRQMAGKLEATQRALDQASSTGQQLQTNAAGQLNALSDEKQQLSQRLAEMEQHLMQNQQMASQRVGQLEAALAKQRAIVDQMTQTASNKRMFDDTVQGPYNQLNIPAVDGKRGADVDRVKHQARDCIKQYASNFSNFLTYMEEGLQQPGPPPVGSPAEHLVTALKGHSAYLKPLDRTFAAFADGSSDLADFLSSMKVLSMYVTSLAGIYRGCMDHQSAEATCTAALGAANTQTARDVAGIETAFRTLLDRASQLSAGGQSSEEDGAGITEIVGALAQLSAHHGQLSQNYVHRLQQDGASDASTVAINKEALAKTADAAAKLHALLRDTQSVLGGGGQYSVRGVAAIAIGTGASTANINELQNRARKYMDTLRCDPPDSVPYIEALAARSGASRKRPSMMPSDSSGSGIGVGGGGGGGGGGRGSMDPAAIKAYEDRIGALEQEREQSLLEFQLLNMKMKNLEASASAGMSEADPNARPAPRTTSAPSTGVGGDNAAGTEALQRHFEERIQLLTTQLQFADSKAVAYYDECRNTALRLEMLRNSQATQAEEHKGVNSTIASLKEDNECMKRNYEEQLSTMTEHIMVMNDKLQQKDAEVGQATSKSKTKSRGSRTRRRDAAPQEEVPNFF